MKLELELLARDDTRGALEPEGNNVESLNNHHEHLLLKGPRTKEHASTAAFTSMSYLTDNTTLPELVKVVEKVMLPNLMVSSRWKTIHDEPY